jgi:D-beta-D-heptose 7-phosphate kinase/D-beta-D-heptose 1-phosphate adenosyltransferase
VTGRLVVVGDVLLDRDVAGRAERLAPDAPVPVVDVEGETVRPGGAGLAAALAAADGHEVTLVAAVADDAAGHELRAAIAQRGVKLLPLALDGPTPEKVRVLAGARPVARLDRGGRGAAVGQPDAAALHALRDARAVLVSDYGRGVAAQPAVREALAALPAATPVVWDPHPKGPEPVAGVTLATPNQAEGRRFARADDDAPPAAVAAHVRDRWGAVAVALTLGAGGALLAHGGGAPLLVPAEPVRGGDPCGAGDRFASTAAAALGAGALPSEAVVAAVAAATAFVAAGGAATARPTHNAQRPTPNAQCPTPNPFALARDVHARGGTVVATGGCFDVLHAGHVALLARARRLGDCLIVCLNSDASVRRLKGADRPLCAQSDRAAVLEALESVDAIAVFDEDTPEAVLHRLRPHVWVKGGDYAGADLPEAELVASWGGQALVLPYIAGRSSSRLIERMVDANA